MHSLAFCPLHLSHLFCSLVYNSSMSIESCSSCFGEGFTFLLPLTTFYIAWIHSDKKTKQKKKQWSDSVFHIISWSRFVDEVTHLNWIPTKQECTRDKSLNRACNKLEQNPDGSTHSDTETLPDFVKLNVFALFQRRAIKGFSGHCGGIKGLHTCKAEALSRPLEESLDLLLTVWKLIKQIRLVYSQGYLKTLT